MEDKRTLRKEFKEEKNEKIESTAYIILTTIITFSNIYFFAFMFHVYLEATGQSKELLFFITLLQLINVLGWITATVLLM